MIAWQMPEEFANRMRALLGDEFDAFTAALESDKVQALRLNPLKVQDTAAALDLVQGAGLSLEQVPWEENGYRYDTEQGAPGKHPYHEAGLYYIQEPSAMAPVHFLAPQPGERILDLCAAPGGKSTQIAVAMKGEGILISNEINAARAKILSLNIERLGIRNCMVTSMSPAQLADRFEGYFDRILVDAPCSGEGMLRKSEQAQECWSIDNINLCAERQVEILDCAARMLAPNGQIVYSTCTFAPEEDEGSIEGFLMRHPDFSLLPLAPAHGMVSGSIPGTLRLFPHKLNGEGHFVAALTRGDVAQIGSGHGSYVPGGIQKSIREKACKPWLEFKEKFLHWEPDGILFLYGDQLYLAPDQMPSTDHLKCLRPGLHLGTIKKDRFEPSHALALALQPTQCKYSLQLAASDPQLAGYLHGQTIMVTEDMEGHDLAPNGWYLICTDGISIGWGKRTNHVIKNHYPKGLRTNY